MLLLSSLLRVCRPPHVAHKQPVRPVCVCEQDLFDLDLEYLDDHGYPINDDDGDPVRNYLNTFIFNTFVFCQVRAMPIPWWRWRRGCATARVLTVGVSAWRPQVFNEFNSRSIGNDWNVWSGLHRNGLFIGVIVVTVGLQAFIIEVRDARGILFRATWPAPSAGSDPHAVSHRGPPGRRRLHLHNRPDRRALGLGNPYRPHRRARRHHHALHPG